MSIHTITKAQINQKCIREPVKVDATIHILALLNVDGVPTIYFQHYGETYPVWIRAFLTGDSIDNTTDIDADKGHYVNTLHIWGLTLHFYVVKFGQDKA